MNLRENLNVFWKIQKSAKLCQFQKKKEVTKIDENGNEKAVTISYQIKFISSVIFMATSLLNCVDNCTKEIHKIKFKGHDSFLEYESEKIQ